MSTNLNDILLAIEKLEDCKRKTETKINEMDEINNTATIHKKRKIIKKLNTKIEDLYVTM